MTGHAVGLSTICSSGRLNFIKEENGEKAHKKKVWFEPVNVLAAPVFSCVYFAGKH